MPRDIPFVIRTPHMDQVQQNLTGRNLFFKGSDKKGVRKFFFSKGSDKQESSHPGVDS